MNESLEGSEEESHETLLFTQKKECKSLTLELHQHGDNRPAEAAGWGAGNVDRLSHELRAAFPNMRGLSPLNLKYMRVFAAISPEREIVQRTVAQILWRSDLALPQNWTTQRRPSGTPARPLSRTGAGDTGTADPRVLYERQGNAFANFLRTLPPAESDLGHAGFQGSVSVRLPQHRPKGNLPTIEEIEAEFDGRSAEGG